jgi:hypothetical protein
MSKKKKRRKVTFVTLSPTKIEVTSFNGLDSRIHDMVRSMHEAMITDVLRAIKVRVAQLSFR